VAFLVCIFCASVVAHPPKLSFTHLAVADGLSHADVRAIAQDHQGFMWFGTWLGGLNRYDGYTFKVYKHDDQDAHSLGCDSIWALYVDRAGVLWVGTNEGVDRYDRDTDSFIHYHHRADDPTSLPGHLFWSFCEDQSGTLWVASSEGLSRFDRTRGRFIVYRHKPDDAASFADINIGAVSVDRTTGLLWLSSWHQGVTVLDAATSHFVRYKNAPRNPASLSNNDVFHIYQDRSGVLWISTRGGLNRFDRQTQTFIRYLHDPRNPASLSDDWVTATYEDRTGRFWVATNHGLNLMDRVRGTFTRYLHDPNDSSSLSSDVINYRTLYGDASGALWMGTRSAGVDRLAGEPEKFITYRHNSQHEASPSNNVITALATSSTGVLWIGTEAGVDRFDGKTFKHYIADPNDPTSLSPGPQRTVAPDSQGSVWVGTYGGGLDRLDGERVQHFRHDPRNSDSLANNNINSLLADPRGGVWIGLYGAGLDYFDGRHFTHFGQDAGNPAGLPVRNVDPLLLDRDGMLWLGTNTSGLIRFDTHTRRFTTYILDPSQPGSQAANWTEDAYSDGAGIWVASVAGLYRFDPKTGRFTHHYTEKDGLTNNSVVGVLGDAQGNIWVSTVKGLSRFDPRTRAFRNYDAFDGLQGNDFFPRCRAQAPGGQLFFGGNNGLSSFSPDKLVDNPRPPPVVLTGFELFNKPVRIGGRDSPLREAIHAAQSITLRHEQSVFRIQFAALNYTAPQKNRYAYRLDGFDRDWQYTDATRRFATYTNLDHGDYTFLVKASNNDGTWNEQGVKLQIRIMPPWWSTLWFRALAFASLVLSIWFAHQLRMRQLQREFNAQLEGRVDERLRVARELHDTLLQSFQGLAILFQAARNTLASRPAEATNMLDKALSRTSQAIAEGREAIQGMRSCTLAFNELPEAILAVAGEHASEGSPEFRVTVEGVRRDVRPIVRDEAYQIAREAIRNAFHHAQAKVIEVEIAYGHGLRLRVRDDGKGIDPAILKQGRTGHYGICGMRERAGRIGGKVSVWSAPGAGTEWELTIPGFIAYGTSHREGLRRLFRRKHRASPPA